MSLRFQLRLGPAAAIKAIALISVYLALLALMPPPRTTMAAVAAAYKSLTAAERTIVLAEEPAQ